MLMTPYWTMIDKATTRAKALPIAIIVSSEFYVHVKLHFNFQQQKTIEKLFLGIILQYS